MFIFFFGWGSSESDYSSDDTLANFLTGTAFGWALVIGFTIGLTFTCSSEESSSSSEEETFFFWITGLAAFAFLSTEAFLCAALAEADLYSSMDALDPFLAFFWALGLVSTGVSSSESSGTTGFLAGFWLFLEFALACLAFLFESSGRGLSLSSSLESYILSRRYLDYDFFSFHDCWKLN